MSFGAKSYAKTVTVAIAQQLQIKEPTENRDLVTQYKPIPRQQSVQINAEKPYTG